MAKCVICRERLKAAGAYCRPCASLVLVSQLEVARAEIYYLRARCEEEGVAVVGSEGFSASWSAVPARQPGSRSPGGESDG